MEIEYDDRMEREFLERQLFCNVIYENCNNGEVY